MLRQYDPKKSDLAQLTHKELEVIEFEINNKPMKIRDWKTPYEVMMSEKSHSEFAVRPNQNQKWIEDEKSASERFDFLIQLKFS